MEEGKGNNPTTKPLWDVDITREVVSRLERTLSKDLFSSWGAHVRVRVADDGTWQILLPNAYVRRTAEPILRPAISTIASEVDPKVRTEFVVDPAVTKSWDESFLDHTSRALAPTTPVAPVPCSLEQLVGKPFTAEELQFLRELARDRLSDEELVSLVRRVPELQRSGRIRKSPLGYVRTIILNGSWRAFVKTAAASGAANNEPQKLTPITNTAALPFRSPRCVEFECVFVPDKCKNEFLSFTRTYLENGAPVRQRILIGKSSATDKPRGVLKVVHQNALYLLLHLWNVSGCGTAMWRKPEGQDVELGIVELTPHELTTRLAGSWGLQNYEWAKKILTDLKTIPINITEEREGRAAENRTFFLLADFAGRARYDGDGLLLRRRSGIVRIFFSETVTAQFKSADSRILSYQTYRSLPFDYAKLAYPYLDLQLHAKREFHIKALALLRRFGISPWSKDDPANPCPNDELVVARRYAEKRIRGQLLRRIAGALDSVPHSIGGFVHVWATESRDDADWVLTAVRTGAEFEPSCASCISRERIKGIPKEAP